MRLRQEGVNVVIQTNPGREEVRRKSTPQPGIPEIRGWDGWDLRSIGVTV